MRTAYRTQSKKIFRQSFLPPKPWHSGRKCYFSCVIKYTSRAFFGSLLRAIIEKSPALFQNILKFCSFLPKFSDILQFFAVFWKIARMPLLSRIGPDFAISFKGFTQYFSPIFLENLPKIEHSINPITKLVID